MLLHDSNHVFITIIFDYLGRIMIIYDLRRIYYRQKLQIVSYNILLENYFFGKKKRHENLLPNKG